MNRWQCTPRAPVAAGAGAAGGVVHPLTLVLLARNQKVQNTRLTLVCSRLAIVSERDRLKGSFSQSKATTGDT